MLAQMLARTKAYNYVTNYVARFWDAPYLAGLIERKINLRAQPFSSAIRSTYGVTCEPHEPHEFGFFWNKWLVFEDGTHRIDESRMPDSHVQQFRQELRALMSLYDQPFFIKSDLVGLNVSFFSRLFDDIVFVVLKRDPLFVAQSIYQARVQLYGDPAVYWSTRPSNRPDRSDLSPAEQIAMQIKGVYDDVYTGLQNAGARYIEVQYEALCRQPRQELACILSHTGLDETALTLPALAPMPGNRRYLPGKTIRELVRALADIL